MQILSVGAFLFGGLPMPANHCVPHTPEVRAKISAAVRGLPRHGKRRKFVSINGVDHHKCTTCQRLIPIADFYKNKRSATGIKSECKSCHCKTSLKTRDVQNARNINRVSEMNRRARKAGSNGVMTRRLVIAVIEIFASKCAACWSDRSIELDHVVPLSKQGPNNPTNLQCLCSACNDKKHTAIADYRTDEHRRQLDELWAITFRRTETDER
jgi:5-methylcytosine-specific restriction endonuclease McrA